MPGPSLTTASSQGDDFDTGIPQDPFDLTRTVHDDRVEVEVAAERRTSDLGISGANVDLQRVDPVIGAPLHQIGERNWFQTDKR